MATRVLFARLPWSIDMKRIAWIDFLRGLCMIAILLDHTELYYAGVNIIDYGAYVENALCIFFFISGYLFFGKNDYRHKLYSILRCLLLPYFVFTLIIAVPKAVVHGYPITDGLVEILTGEASWFVSALIVAELLFLGILRLSRNKEGIMIVCSAVSFVCCLLLLRLGNSTDSFIYYWNIDNALMAVPLLYLGWTYHKHERIFSKLNGISFTVFILLIVVIVKDYEYNYSISMLVEPIAVGNWLIFAIDIATTTLLMINLSKGLKSVCSSVLMRAIECTGKRSLIYYFFCGAVPLTVSSVFDKFGFVYHGSYARVILVFLLVYFLTSVIAWIVYRYFPFLVKPTSKS